MHSILFSSNSLSEFYIERDINTIIAYEKQSDFPSQIFMVLKHLTYVGRLFNLDNTLLFFSFNRYLFTSKKRIPKNTSIQDSFEVLHNFLASFF